MSKIKLHFCSRKSTLLSYEKILPFSTVFSLAWIAYAHTVSCASFLTFTWCKLALKSPFLFLTLIKFFFHLHLSWPIFCSELKLPRNYLQKEIPELQKPSNIIWISQPGEWAPRWTMWNFMNHAVQIPLTFPLDWWESENPRTPGAPVLSARKLDTWHKTVSSHCLGPAPNMRQPICLTDGTAQMTVPGPREGQGHPEPLCFCYEEAQANVQCPCGWISPFPSQMLATLMKQWSPRPTQVGRISANHPFKILKRCVSLMEDLSKRTS